MAEVKPWEQVPDDGYWRSLLDDSDEQRTPQSTPPTVTPSTLADAPMNGAQAGDGTSPSLSGWTLAEKSYTQGDSLELRVVGYNRGGLLVDLGQVRGFVPASQLLSFPRKAQEEERMQELAGYINKMLRLKVIEFDRSHNRLILSERIANPPASRVEQTLAAIQPQQTCTGVIRNITDFGAFVDLGGVEGLIHISEFSWQHVNHPRDVVSPGQQVQVYVMDVDREQKRIACSLKRLTPNPWAQVAETLHPEEWIDGTVTNVVSFGAFVRVADGVEGLIHVSELAEGSFLHPRDVVREGELVHARVISVDAGRQRIALSLRYGSSSRAERGNGGVKDSHKPKVIYDNPPPPPPPDAGYWESLAQSGV